MNEQKRQNNVPPAGINREEEEKRPEQASRHVRLAQTSATWGNLTRAASGRERPPAPRAAVCHSHDDCVIQCICLFRLRSVTLFVEESPDVLRQFGREKFDGHRILIRTKHRVGRRDFRRFCVHDLSPL
ncbi:hypothetical protein [Caballeronia sp. LZ032]|uniref:hypothetical protein n=1 Tax=Caballeronia sp. LZ032 TaxID=3038565 RepID=UPI00285FC40E|nr:hypothetical protein [Caballeronia sp. LZ032]MDR5877334.1 hypothetical protein [Caballeronia sp. LZ032]